MNVFFFQFFAVFSGSGLYISQPLERFLVRSMAAKKKVRYAARRGLVKPISAQVKRSESVVPSAATTAAPGMHWTQIVVFSSSKIWRHSCMFVSDAFVAIALAETVLVVREKEGEVVVGEEVYERMAEELSSASPLEIMDRALEKFGDDIAIAFRFHFFFLFLFQRLCVDY